MSTLDRAAVMRRDFFKLRRAHAKPDDPRVRESAALREAREEAIGRLDLGVPGELPIAEQADEIVKLLRSHQVVVVAGETGSGKTTQLPKLCLQAGLGRGASIGHTQPRRIAARTVAQRIASECGSAVGADVGFAVRFSDQTSERTIVKIMTDGLLLTEIRRDRFLDSYDAIIVDEAHERSLNVDFLLGYLKRLLAKRDDLRVIVTSATIDVDRFATFFDGAPVVEVGGRTFPVEVRYRETPEDEADALVEVLEEIAREPLGPARDVLVFFSGEREIFEAARSLRRQFGDRYEVLPLYARLSAAEQQKVFSTVGSHRRVVLATNVAETSLTVPNIGYVIDPGFARINRYSYRSKLQRLPIEPVSQASADQRKGRCGRIAPGTCYRLYREEDYLSRDAYTDPEIRRVNLASVVLQMHAFGLGDIGKFPFVDPPDGRAVKDALRLLNELAAIEGGKLTAIGKQMARMPVDPRLARMLVESSRAGCLRELMIIVAGLAVQDPRERPLEKSQAADAAHAEFVHDRSDFLSYVKMWEWIEAERQANTRSRWQNILRKRFLSMPRVHEWREVHRQLKLVCRDLSFRENTKDADYRTIHECVLAGSLSLIAHHDERGQYTGARNLKLRIFPGSGLAKKTPRWIVSAEVVETSRVYARCAAYVEAQWIERQAHHLLKRRHSDPVWSLKRGEVIAYESAALYGLRLVEKRAVPYGNIDPDYSRDVFLREGLIRGGIAKPPAFLKANLALVAKVRDLEAKGRRRDILAPDDVLYQFYATRIPREINRVSDLEKWLRGRAPDQQAALFVTEGLLNQKLDASVGEDDFPNEMEIGGARYELKYRFAPGDKDDGISIRVPSGLLHALGAEPLEWSVPGMLPAVVEHWLRSLPKAKRRALAPIQDRIEELTERLLDARTYRQGRFLAALTGLLDDLYRVRVESSEWDRSRIPDHLLVNVVVVDPKGRVIAQDRDLTAVKHRLEGDDEAPSAARLEGLTAFPERDVPAQELVNKQSAQVMTYPGFVDKGDCVDLTAFTRPAERSAANRRGYPRLALLALGSTGAYLKKELKKEKEIGLYFASLGSAETLYDEILRNTVWYCFFEAGELPFSRESFARRIQERRGELAGVFRETVDRFKDAMRLRFEIIRQSDALTSPAYQPSIEDVRRVLDGLVPADFLERTPYAYLQVLPRYLEGLSSRLADLPGRVPRDRALIEELVPLERRLEKIANVELFDPHVYTALRFYLEELRLRQFAEKRAKHKADNHPLKDLKVSMKKVSDAIRDEELRVGLA